MAIAATWYWPWLYWGSLSVAAPLPKLYCGHFCLRTPPTALRSPSASAVLNSFPYTHMNFIFLPLVIFKYLSVWLAVRCMRELVLILLESEGGGGSEESLLRFLCGATHA